MSTNIPRITQKIFAQNAAEDDLLQFGSVLSGNATPSTSIAETQTEAYQTGWRSAVISDRNYPTLGEMNAVQQVPTQQLAYLFQKGVPEWDASTTYFANVSYCQVNGVIYKSLTDNNIGNNPTTDSGTNWIIADLSNKITNCILAAPNGVATYSGNTITVKQGLKVLIPNGRNTDETLNNIEYTFNETTEYTETLSTSYSNRLLFWNQSGVTHITSYYLQGLYSEIPTTLSTNYRYVYYAVDQNKLYSTLGSSVNWIEFTGVAIGFLTWDVSTQTLTLIPYQPVSLAKEQDIDGVWVQKDFVVADNVNLNGNNLTYDLSNYLPKDGNTYEIIVSAICDTTNTNGAYAPVYLRTDILTNQFCVCRARTRTTSTMNGGGGMTIVVGSSRKLYLDRTTSYAGTAQIVLKAYRKVR